MAFTSYDFLLFFFIVFVLYWTVRERRWQNLLLLAAGYYFYGSLQVWYAVLLGASTLADFALARGMAFQPERRRSFLWLSLFLNLGVLAFFKYYNFFADDVIAFLTALGVEPDLFLASILLPAGLSFFTLKKLGYMLDVSRGTLKPTHSLVDFALYVSFFPQIVAGPIDRPQNLLPQFEAARRWKTENLAQAFPLILMGFFKKLVVANSVQILVDRVFGFAQPSGLLLLSGALGYTLQILADFSAYTDLSRGIAFLLGFNTVENFRQPYLSLTPTDFWNRWHISLSTWLRDYVFFPIRRALLRFKLNEKLAMSIPPLATMFVSGLWHGAGLNFVVWGLYYGALIAAYQLIGIRGDWKPASKITTFFAWLAMFAFIVFGWMMFRAPSLDWLVNIFIHSPFIPSRSEFVLALITFTAALAYSIPLLVNHLIDQHAKGTWLQAAFYAIAAALIVIYVNSTNSDFIYFQF
ncbi:MAG: MBOAT family protein [Chloroflexi bacterium]|nr:MBOAT family protein [Chloroflexota bacterium]MDL1943523.1 MBOAT family protein [Chloroflexi bacterium CFX2]